MNSCEGIFSEPCSIRFDPARPALASKLTVRRLWFRTQIFGRTLFPYEDKEFVQLHTLLLWSEHQCMTTYYKESRWKLSMIYLIWRKFTLRSIRSNIDINFNYFPLLCVINGMVIVESLTNNKIKSFPKA